MAHHQDDQVRQGIVRVLDDAQAPMPAADFLTKVVAECDYDQDVVVGVVRQMLQGGELKFDTEMRVVLAKVLA